jgi:type II secretory pathway pseudopilin PulG
MSGDRRGMALIETLLSIVLLGTTGASMLVLLGQTRASIHSMQATEQTTDSASDVLERLVLEDRDALMRRVGWMVAGSFALRVERVSPSLFDVDVAREPGGAPVLSTTLYRADSTDAR